MSSFDRYTLFIGYHEVYKTIDGGANWSQLTDFHSLGVSVSNAIKAIALTKANEDVIYVGYDGATWATPGTVSKLFKTIDGGTIWDDITLSIGNIVEGHGITDIKISDIDPNKIWISFGSFQDNNGTAINRVIYSSDGGNNWADITFNLPNLPVNCLQGIIINNDYHIIAGLDLGVFIFDEGQNNWINISNGLPMAIVTDIEVNYAKSELRIASFGRGIWKTKLPCSLFGDEIHITSNEVWSTNTIVMNNIYVEENKTLEINSVVCFAADASIILKPGAKLIIDGGKLTNACDESWQGIQVWGNKTAHQYPDANGNYQQGYVELKNGAVIENAWEAIQPWNPDHWNQTGGIIKANGATFRNNRRAVQFMSYENFDPTTGEHRPNQSTFRNCTFETTSDFDELFGEGPFHTFVSMFKVDGVKFYACDFEDKRTEFYDPQPENQAVGIWTIDANFYVLPICDTYIYDCWNCPTSNITPSTFTGLNMGVYSSQSSTTNTFVIDRVDFLNNLFGIYNVTNNQASCIRSTFEVGGKQTTAPFYMPTGILNYASTGFTFDQNNFSPDINLNSTIDFHTGIWNLDTGDDENSVFKNSFTGMGNANLAGGDNHNNYWPEKGLIYKCNTNTNNVKYDFRTYGGEGIASYQGSEKQATGNTFCHLTNPEGSDFANQATWPVNYYYYIGNPDEDPSNTINVWKKGAPQNSCVDKYSIGSNIRLTETERDFYRQQYYYNKAEYDNTKYLYEDLKDGGDTPGTKLDVETAWADETWELRAQLLADSPHLSLDVLYAAAKKTDVLPHTIMFEICIANPEEMRNEEFLNFLETKDDPMPSYMVDDLREGADEDTYKSVLQNELASYISLWGEACNYLIRDIVLDSTGIEYDSLRLWLTNNESLNSAYEIVDSYIAQDSITAALSYLTNIPNNFDLSADQLTEYNYFYDLKTVLISAQQQSRNILQLDSLEVTELVEIADTSNFIAGAQAQSILNFGYGYSYLVFPDLPNEPNLKQSRNIEDYNDDWVKAINDNHFIEAFPNPASTWVTFKYTLPYQTESALIEVVDISGLTIKTIEVDSPFGQMTWDTRNIQTGLYIYNLKVNNNIIDQRKLIINNK
ncbi:MAG: hypothetical protein CO098_19340 [Bacteroidetes bacterium CG_4_9_14_3_um_filter_41_19]|nr:MAG: hypothetical protein CO098_19340 [Bacteroidetes bacterium CG_4_9_14_3_um_filter_41_19]